MRQLEPLQIARNSITSHQFSSHYIGSKYKKESIIKSYPWHTQHCNFSNQHTFTAFLLFSQLVPPVRLTLSHWNALQIHLALKSLTVHSIIMPLLSGISFHHHSVNMHHPIHPTLSLISHHINSIPDWKLIYSQSHIHLTKSWLIFDTAIDNTRPDFPMDYWFLITIIFWLSVGEGVISLTGTINTYYLLTYLLTKFLYQLLGDFWT